MCPGEPANDANVDFGGLAVGVSCHDALIEGFQAAHPCLDPAGGEDGIGDMTVPRLKANGAILENIIEIQGVSRDGVRSTFSMQDDILNVVELLKDGIARDDGSCRH